MIKKSNGAARNKKVIYRKQPRLRNGIRIPRYSAMHEAVQLGLQQIARMEKKSVSWVIHEIIAAYFGRDVMGDKF